MSGKRRTRTHVERASSTVCFAVRICGGKTEVGEVYMLSVFADEDVFGLKVAMVYPCVMARLQSVDDLKEQALDERIVPAVDARTRQESEEVAAGAVVEDEEDVKLVLDDAVEGDDVRVARQDLVEVDLLSLEGVSSRALLRTHDALDCVLGWWRA